MQSRIASCVMAAMLVVACGGNQPPEPPDAGGPIGGPTCLDNDGDGVTGTGDCSGQAVIDCDDGDPTVYPGAPERCDGLDNDCDGELDEGLAIHDYLRDEDGDGFGAEKTGEGCGPAPAGSVTQAGDCDDSNPEVHPDAAETCNAVDDDCNGATDDGLQFKDFYPDLDGDGFGDGAAAPTHSCLASVAGRVANDGDCDDSNPVVKPGALELCNKVDDNCDGRVDNGITFLDYYSDADGDGFGRADGLPESSCSTVLGKVTNAQDCDDQDPTVKPGAPERCNGVDDDCDGQVDDGLQFLDYYPDVDGDGHGAMGSTAQRSCAPVPGKVTSSDDCNDANVAVKPGAPESCNGVDDDCDGQLDDGLTFLNYYADHDGDGFGAGGPQSACQPIAGRVTNNQDCDDQNPSIKPTATEQCNGVDDNCNGQTDEGLTFLSYYPDADGDTYGAKGSAAQSSCLPVSGKVTNNQDCDDTRASVKPGATEACNGLDDDCDGPIDEGLQFLDYWPDLDGDGFGAANAQPRSSCSAQIGWVTNNTDCNDGNAGIRPDALELCNGVDDNCNGAIDDGVATQNYYPDFDGDGYGAESSTPQPSCSAIAGKVTNNEDCNDGNPAIKPSASEVCNGLDDDCDGQTDEGLTFLSYYPDLDSDGYGASGSLATLSCAPLAGKVTNDADCNDGNANINPGKAEVCDEVDQNCNGQADEGLPTQSYYPDVDGDGFGAVGSTPLARCGPVPGRVTNNTDCNDGNPAVKPNASESCNNVDDDCDGQTDEGNPGGGSSCVTGQPGVCSAGTVTCQSGALTCLRNQGPSAELCNGLDDDCDNGTDEDFTNKGQTCSAGLGVCQRSGTFACKADGSGTQCTATPGAPTAPACDGQDNDCDGVADEPYLSATSELTPLAYQDVEVVPHFYSSTGCAGGVNGSGSDALAGGAAALSVGTGGLYLQRLDVNGAPSGSPTAAASSLQYGDIALAQAGDGYFMAGIWIGSTMMELDVYFMDASTGAKRAEVWSLFNIQTSVGTYDSLRVVRGNGKRVTVLWRDSSVGIRMARFEPIFDGATSTWSIKGPAGAAITSSTLVAGTGIHPGLGADSTHWDWDSTQSCESASTLRKLRVAYLPTPHSLKYFDVNEDGSGKGAEVVVDTVSEPYRFGEPEVAFFRSGSADQWAIAFTTANTGAAADEDLNYWLTTNPSIIDYAYFEYATENGADSISRPRLSVSPTRLWLSALRYVADPSGFKRQVMTRKLTYAGARDPSSTLVELSATSGACSGDPPCRPGNKDGLASWAAKGRLFYGASGGTPAGTYASTLTCQ